MEAYTTSANDLLEIYIWKYRTTFPRPLRTMRGRKPLFNTLYVTFLLEDGARYDVSMGEILLACYAEGASDLGVCLGERSVG